MRKATLGARSPSAPQAPAAPRMVGTLPAQGGPATLSTRPPSESGGGDSAAAATNLSDIACRLKTELNERREMTSQLRVALPAAQTKRERAHRREASSKAHASSKVYDPT
jgi:hypothetical protein